MSAAPVARKVSASEIRVTRPGVAADFLDFRPALLQLARYVQTRVFAEFGVRLQPEPVLVGVSL